MISNIFEVVGAVLVIAGLALFSIPVALIATGVAIAALGYTLGDRKGASFVAYWAPSSAMSLEDSGSVISQPTRQLESNSISRTQHRLARSMRPSSCMPTLLRAFQLVPSSETAACADQSRAHSG